MNGASIPPNLTVLDDCQKGSFHVVWACIDDDQKQILLLLQSIVHLQALEGEEAKQAAKANRLRLIDCHLRFKESMEHASVVTQEFLCMLKSRPDDAMREMLLYMTQSCPPEFLVPEDNRRDRGEVSTLSTALGTTRSTRTTATTRTIVSGGTPRNGATAGPPAESKCACVVL